MNAPTKADLRATIDLQVAILALVLPILEKGNASYHAMQCTRKMKADCPTLGPLVKLVREAIDNTHGGN